MILKLLSVLFVTASAQAVVLKRLSSCDSSANVVSTLMTQEHQKLSDFPNGLFLAREVVHTIESQGSLIYKTHQNMLNDSDLKSQTCYWGQPRMVFKSQALLPVLIDQTSSKKVGHAYWKFSLDVENNVGASKSQRSLVSVQDLHERLIEQGFQIEKVQISHAEFELRLKRVNSQSTEYYIVLFDRKLTIP